MGDNEKNDLLGLKPYGQAVKIATQGAVDGASALLSRICLPAAKEYGLLLEDKVRSWRTNNLVAITQVAEHHLGDSTDQAHPRLVSSIIDNGSWADDTHVQKMWGGLLASSCSEDGDDDSNLLFIDTLASITKSQARLLNYICLNAKKYILISGLPFAHELIISVEILKRVSEIDDLIRIDRELDHLRSLELIIGGIASSARDFADVRPTPIALSMFIRCAGSRQTPNEFFNLTVPEEMLPKEVNTTTEEAVT